MEAQDPALAQDGPRSSTQGLLENTPSSESLNVIALVSGGKDSFYSALHCIKNGHRIVALANLFPAAPDAQPVVTKISPPIPGASIASGSAGTCKLRGNPVTEASASPSPRVESTLAMGVQGSRRTEANPDQDLNSLMYQTVGHEVVPLYATATGLPVYRHPIVGRAVQQARDYSSSCAIQSGRGPSSANDPSRYDANALDARPAVSFASVPATLDAHGPPEPAGGTIACASRLEGSFAVPTRPEGSTGHDSGPGTGHNKEHQGRGGEAVSFSAHQSETTHVSGDRDPDETESMLPLLQSVIKDHPEANAICTGAILSTYQRTRVESVAMRLGLTPLAYLWKYPVLPSGQNGPSADAQLLLDMANANLDARIIKVASGGLDEVMLWEKVSSHSGASRIQRAMSRFGGGDCGSVIGEGGEFETLVLDGPPSLFQGHIEVAEEDRGVVREGGGTAWLKIDRAVVKMKAVSSSREVSHFAIRIPFSLDERFEAASDKPFLYELKPQDATAEAKSGKHGIVQSVQNVVHWMVVAEDEPWQSSIEEQTKLLVQKIHALMGSHSVCPSNITNTVIVLRHMRDFPVVNKIYGSLFPEPNPPARVTISCGDQLPTKCNIVICLTVDLGLDGAERRGLHVQSRSYWAPANIGPYSQAIDVPLLGAVTDGTGDLTVKHPLRLISIAGQIPLLPQTMNLPSPESKTSPAVLSLQHLWRIGMEMKVQWWTSAVVYLDSAHSILLSEAVKRIYSVWAHANLWSASTEEDDDDAGPDAWDKKYNPQYLSLGGGECADHQLPDYSVLESGAERPVPFVFFAEVEELPRKAPVEWHAHLGLGGLSPGSVRLMSRTVTAEGRSPFHLYHTMVRSPEALFIHSVVVIQGCEAVVLVDVPPIPVEHANEALVHSLEEHVGTVPGGLEATEPYLIYTNMEMAATKRPRADIWGHYPGFKYLIIPCRNVMDGAGAPLAAVLLYRHTLLTES